MRFKGRNRIELAESEQRWKDWCRQMRRRPQLRDFAEQLTVLIEGRVNSRTHVAALAEKAMKEAGSAELTDAQLREVILMLHRVWEHGLSLRNWARRKTSLLRSGD